MAQSLPLLEAVQRQIKKWVLSRARVIGTLTSGQTIIDVDSSLRFSPGDEVAIMNADDDPDVEAGLIVVSVPSLTRIVVDQVKNYEQGNPPIGISHNWTESELYLQKMVFGQYVKGVHLGEPDVIAAYPAITISGSDKSSEWYTVRQTKEKYNVEIGVFVHDQTMENGVRFMHYLTDIIEFGLKRNIYPLVGPYRETFLIDADNNPPEDLIPGDGYCVYVEDGSNIIPGRSILIENEHYTEEHHVDSVQQVNGHWVLHLTNQISNHFKTNLPGFNTSTARPETVVVQPSRFFYNSWPSSVKYGNIHKGTLLKAASISWFAEETELQGDHYPGQDPRTDKPFYGGWRDPQKY